MTTKIASEFTSALKNRDEFLIDFVLADPRYCQYVCDFNQQAQARVDDITGRIAISESLAPLLHDSAICLRGSYAYKHPTEFSDVDILLVTASERYDKAVLRCLRGLVPGSAMSIWQIPLARPDLWPRNMEFWQTITQLRYVAGNRHLCTRFLEAGFSAFATLTFSDLLCAHCQEFNDCDWLDPGSPHFYDIERGCGGLLEQAFVSVLKRWCESLDLPLTEAQHQCGRNVEKHNQYLILLKHCLSKDLGRKTSTRQIFWQSNISQDLWFFRSPNAIRLLAQESHCEAARFVSMLPQDYRIA